MMGTLDEFMNTIYPNICRMITCQEKALDEMRRGLFDVLPSGSLDALTAEDFRLLLNGVSKMYNKDREIRYAGTFLILYQLKLSIQ